MKKCLLIIFTILCLPPLSHADTIYMLADDWCPYNCSPGSERPGFVIEIAQTIFKASGHKVMYQKMPWKRAVVMARAGDYHAIVAAAVTDAPDFIFPKNEQGVLKYTFYTKKGNLWVYTGISSLENQELGVIGGYTYSDEIDNYVTARKGSVKVQVVHGDEPLEQLIKMLLYGRITALIDDAFVTSYVLARLNHHGSFREAGILISKKVYIAFSPNHPKSREYAAVLSKGMVSLRKSGKIKQIMAKYGLKDWK